MNGDLDKKDPALAALFAGAEEDLPGQDFAASLTDQLDRRKSRVLWVKLAMLGVIAVFGLLMSGPLISFSAWLVDFLSTPIVDAGDSLLGDIASPLNSLSLILALIYFTVWKFWRRLQGN